MLSGELISKTDDEEDCGAQLMLQEPIAAYPAPFFAALPFLSMGLPFPPMYVYPQLSPFIYYQPFVQMPTAAVPANNSLVPDDSNRPAPKPKPACGFCMEHEASLSCLYYEHDPLATDDAAAAGDAVELPADVVALPEIDKEEPVQDENTPASAVATAKNPGWFGKGYRKGMKRKR